MNTVKCDNKDCTWKQRQVGQSVVTLESFEDDQYTIIVMILGEQLEFKIKDHHHLCNRCLEKLKQETKELILSNPALELVRD